MKKEEQFEKLVKDKVVIKKENCYFYNKGAIKFRLGTKKHMAILAIEKLYKTGKVTSPYPEEEDIAKYLTDTAVNPEPQKPKIADADKEAKAYGQLPSVNPKLKEIEKLPKQVENVFSPLLQDLGDIESFVEGGAYKVYVYGTDSLLRKHPDIIACPLEFAWKETANNRELSNGTFNQQWKVVSKKLIGKDRSGNPIIATGRDDTPLEDFFHVGRTTLCCCDKKQFIRKQIKEAMSFITHPVEFADSRIEKAEKAFSKSKVDPKGSFDEIINDNRASRQSAKDYLEERKNYSNDNDVETQLANLQRMVNGGQAGRSQLRLDEI